LVSENKKTLHWGPINFAPCSATDFRVSVKSSFSWNLVIEATRNSASFFFCSFSRNKFIFSMPMLIILAIPDNNRMPAWFKGSEDG
jgi:hypothetical protein